MELTRDEIFRRASRLLRAEFDELSSVPHSALKGSEAEDIVRKFLNQHLPKRFAAGSGFVLDKNDSVSPQSDVIIYDASNCPVYRASETASIFPNDNVAAVIEVKAKLTKERLLDAAQKIRRCKRMVKSPAPDVPFLVQTRTLGILFAFESAIQLDKVSDHLVGEIGDNGLGSHIDMVVVLDRGVLSLAAWVPAIGSWSPLVWEGPGGLEAEGSHIVVSGTEHGDQTLDVFLRFLLVHLMHFRGLVDHPGFSLAGATGRKSIFRYLTSISLENSEEKRRAYYQHYKELLNPTAKTDK